MATFTYLAQDGPDYITGHAILGAIGLSLLVTLGNIAYIRWESEYYTSHLAIIPWLRSKLWCSANLHS